MLIRVIAPILLIASIFGCNRDKSITDNQDGSDQTASTEIFYDTPEVAGYGDFQFELGVFSDLTLAKQYQRVLPEAQKQNEEGFWKNKSFPYDSDIVPIIWFHYGGENKIFCDYKGAFSIVGSNDQVVWKSENLQLCNWEFPKRGLRPAAQIINLPPQAFNLAPAEYAIKLSMTNGEGRKIDLVNKITVLAKPTTEELLKLTNNLSNKASPLQLFTTTSLQLAQWQQEPITEETWAEILSKTLITSIRPQQTFFATVVVRTAGTDFYGKSRLIAKYSLYDESGNQLLKKTSTPVWSGDEVPKGHVRFAQEPLALEIPQTRAERFFLRADVTDLVTNTTTVLGTTLTVIK